MLENAKTHKSWNRHSVSFSWRLLQLHDMESTLVTQEMRKVFLWNWKAQPFGAMSLKTLLLSIYLFAIVFNTADSSDWYLEGSIGSLEVWKHYHYFRGQHISMYMSRADGFTVHASYDDEYRDDGTKYRRPGKYGQVINTIIFSHSKMSSTWRTCTCSDPVRICNDASVTRYLRSVLQWLRTSKWYGAPACGRCGRVSDIWFRVWCCIVEIRIDFKHCYLHHDYCH